MLKKLTTISQKYNSGFKKMTLCRQKKRQLEKLGVPGSFRFLFLGRFNLNIVGELNFETLNSNK